MRIKTLPFQQAAHQGDDKYPWRGLKML